MQSLFLNWPPAIYDLVGLIGFGLYVLSYFMLTTHRLDSRTCTYFAINLIAAGLVLVSLIGAFNLASLLIQIFWIAVSILAIAKRYRRLSEPDEAASYHARTKQSDRRAGDKGSTWA